MAASSTNDLERLKRMISGPRALRKYVVCQLIFGTIFIYFWYQFNGGEFNFSESHSRKKRSLAAVDGVTKNRNTPKIHRNTPKYTGIVPWFLRRKTPVLHLGSDISPLMYFSHANEDGNNIRWKRHVNSLQKLEDAIRGDVDMISSDVILRGQDTEKQKLVPVMAQLPDTNSFLTFDTWLNEIARSSFKGIKINFQTTDAVEITLQKLRDVKDQLIRPVWLHADILQGPHGSKPRVDHVRFFKHVKRLFPECTLSLGWTTGTHTDLSLSGYSWDNVLDMYHVIMEAELKPPIVISIRSSLIRNSVPQIKWLTDNTRSWIFVWQEKEDRPVAENLMHVAYRFAPEKSYWDIEHKELNTYLKKNRNKSGPNLNPYVKKRDTVLFRPEAWMKMGLYMEHHSILPSEEALVLRSRAVYILTKAKYRPSKLISLNGRVQFLNRKNRDVVPNETGLSIYVRPTAYVDFEHIAGIQCFFGLDGQMKIKASHLRQDFKKTMRFTPGTSNCFRFTVIDAIDEIIFRVTVLHDCHTLESVISEGGPAAELKLKIPKFIGEEIHPFIVKLEDSNRVAVFDELHVKHGQSL